MAGLTSKQHQLLTFLTEYDEKHGCAPSFDEMMAAIGIQSKSGVHRLLTALEERGKIRRLRFRARAIEITDGRSLAHVSTLDLRRELNRRIMGAC